MNKVIALMMLLGLCSFKNGHVTNYPFVEIDSANIDFVIEYRIDKCPCHFYRVLQSDINNKKKLGFVLNLQCKTYALNRDSTRKKYGTDFSCGKSGLVSKITKIDFVGIESHNRIDLTDSLYCEQQYLDYSQHRNPFFANCYYLDSNMKYRFYYSGYWPDNEPLTEEGSYGETLWFIRAIDSVRRISGNDGVVEDLMSDRRFKKSVYQDINTFTTLINQNVYRTHFYRDINGVFWLDRIRNIEAYSQFEISISFTDGRKIITSIQNRH